MPLRMLWICDYVCACSQVLIQNGELLTGGLCKKTLGASGGSLIHVIMMEHGPEGARAFLSQCQYLTNHWLLQHGMSIGIGDTVADAATMGAINDTINKVLPSQLHMYRLPIKNLDACNCSAQFVLNILPPAVWKDPMCMLIVCV